MADEVVVIEYVVKSGNAIADIQKIRENQEKIKQTVKELQQVSGASYKEIASGIKASIQATDKAKLSSKDQAQAIRAVNQATASLTAEQKAAEKATREANKRAEEGARTWRNFGQSILVAFGISIYQVLNSFARNVRDLIDTAIEFGQAINLLAVSTRALQRAGSSITMKETIQQVRELKAMFPIFTTKDAVEAVGFTQLVTRNFQYTKEEMLRVSEISAGLSVLLGKDLNTSARELALFLSSGYAESMQRAGFAVNRLSVVEEAHRMGINKSYMAMTEIERAHAALSLIERQYATVQEDVNKLIDSQAYKVKIAQKSWEELKNSLSMLFLPVIGKVADALKYIAFNLQLLMNLWANTIKYISTMTKLLNTPISFRGIGDFLKDQKEAFVDWIKGMKGAYDDAKTGGNLKELPFGDISSVFADQVLSAEEEGQKLIDVTSQIYQNISSADTQFKNDMKKNQLDYDRELAQLEEDSARKLYDIQQEREQKSLELEKDHTRKSDELQTDHDRKLTELQTDYGRKLSDIELEHGRRSTEISENQKADELKREQDFLDALLKLREDFMLNLEDAVHERDARQIMRLIRQYSLEKTQLERKQAQDRLDAKVAADTKTADEQLRYEQDKIDAETAYKNQQADEAVRFANQQADEETRYTQAQADADDAWKQRVIAEDLRYKREQQDARTNFEQRNADLKMAFDERFQMYVDDLVRSEEITTKGLDRIAKEYEITYGKDGRVETALKNSLQWAQMVAESNSSTIMPSGLSSFWSGGGTYMPSNYAPPTGLNTESWAGQGTYAPPNPNGNLAIQITFSKDVEARIVDDTLNSVAHTIVHITNEKGTKR